MTVPYAGHAPGMKTRLFLRHGTWELNLWAHLTGEAAAKVAGKVVTEEMNYTMGLMTKGKVQAMTAGAAIRGRWPVKAVLFSPYMRTRQTASLGFAGQGILMQPADGLKERDRGIFAYQPSMNIKDHPYYDVDRDGTPRHDVLNWRPTSRDPRRPCETLTELGENRIKPVLAQADTLAPNDVAVFVTSADVVIAARGLLGRFTSERLREPLVADAPDDCIGLKRSNWIQNVQTDAYYWGNPETGERVDPAGPPMYFASFSPYAPTFDTGLIRL